MDVEIDTEVVESDPDVQVVIIPKWQLVSLRSTPMVSQGNEVDFTATLGAGEIGDAYERETCTPYCLPLGVEEAWNQTGRYCTPPARSEGTFLVSLVLRLELERSWQ